MTAYGSVETAVEAMKAGASDFLLKPFSLDHLMQVVHKALEMRALRDENRQLKAELGRRYEFDNIIGRSGNMQEIFATIERVAPTRATVLLTGESGVGKDLIARAIHFHSPRKDRPFVKINCSALPENLMESELFGYEKGAFTGAQGTKPGKFEQADTGTVFLDEIGDVPTPIQVKLLRILQEREFERLGSNVTRHIDVRLVAATNQDLRAALEKAPSAKICTIASTSCPSTFRRCASARWTSPRWPIASCKNSRPTPAARWNRSPRRPWKSSSTTTGPATSANSKT